MKVRIYQIDSEKDSARLIFGNAELFEAEGVPLDALPREIYEPVFEGELEARDLEGIYSILQRRRERPFPAGYSGRSLSCSDVVEILERGDFLLCEAEGLWFVDSFGFKPCGWAE